MAVLEEGKYLGKYKEGDMYYHHFKPEVIGTEGNVKYVRIGDREEEFPSSRNYVLSKVNEEEQKLIDRK